MTNDLISRDDIGLFSLYLQKEEKSRLTIDKYLRDILRFYEYLGDDRSVSKERVISYKEYLGSHYKISSANSMIAALNKFLSWTGMDHCKVKSFKNQRPIFCDQSRELNQNEYERLIKTAQKQGNCRLEMVMQTICATGIRISELRYITLEAVYRGRAEVMGKGKQRTVFIVPKLRRYLISYCKANGVVRGTVFVTRSGKPVNRSNMWAEMKALAQAAKVAMEKIFPHNLRHLFARTCYKKKKDIVYLADILGHSNIETTRVYTISSGKEHEVMLASLGLML